MDLSLDYSSDLSVIETLLGNPAITRTESLADYNAFLSRFISQWNPTGVVEVIFVRDVAHYAWKVERNNEIQRHILASVIVPELHHLLQHCARKRHSINPERFASDWFVHREKRKQAKTELVRAMDFTSLEQTKSYFDRCRIVDILMTIFAADENRRDRATRDLLALRARMSRPTETFVGVAEDVSVAVEDSTEAGQGNGTPGSQER